MSLESATTINQLVQTNPDGSDGKNQGDDHIRLIKKTLQNTFPNITEPLTATAAQLNVLAQDGRTVPSGAVFMWPYSIASIPVGYKFCNGVGTISTGAAVPDMRLRFPFGADADSGGALPPGIFGGAWDHSHGITVDGATLTVDQIPSHNHLTGFSTKSDITAIYGRVNVGVYSGCERTSTNQGYQCYTSSTGGTQPHYHSGSATTASSLPVFLSICFIIKD